MKRNDVRNLLMPVAIWIAGASLLNTVMWLTLFRRLPSLVRVLDFAPPYTSVRLADLEDMGTPLDIAAYVFLGWWWWLVAIVSAMIILFTLRVGPKAVTNTPSTVQPWEPRVFLYEMLALVLLVGGNLVLWIGNWSFATRIR